MAYANGNDTKSGILSSSSVVISRVEYDTLMSLARQYANLRRNLLRRNVGEETIDFLSQDDEAIQAGHPSSAPAYSPADTGGGAPLSPSQPSNSGDYYPFHNGYQTTRSIWAAIAEDDSDAGDGEGVESPPPGANGANGNANGNQRQHAQYYPRNCQRSIVLQNLAEGTTYADITAAVRGGMLLDVFLRSEQRAATVSFLREEDARGFWKSVRRWDLYVRNKRVDIRWADRQFILPRHVADKITRGATRNLVLYNFDPAKHTEAQICEDLEHIHNLAVIKVEFLDGNCYISLNSVHNAIYAWQCMMSRLRYKHHKIVFAPDECAQPFPAPEWFKPRQNIREYAMGQKKAQQVSALNRFHVLKIDDDNDDEAGSEKEG